MHLRMSYAWQRAKPATVAGRSPLDDIIIAADTTVVDEGQILGKPANAYEAESMLRRLRGREHQVFTALAVVRRSEGFLALDWCVTQVPMRTYSDEEMYAYIATGDPLDKAGAYAIQHPDFSPVANLEGCYANVMGLPLCHLKRTLDAAGYPHGQKHPTSLPGRSAVQLLILPAGNGGIR